MRVVQSVIKTALCACALAFAGAAVATSNLEVQANHLAQNLPTADVSAQTPQLAQTSPMAVAIYAFLVQNNMAGQEILTPIAQDTPINAGDVLEYHGYFKNQTGERLRQTSVSLDVPKSLEFIGMAQPNQPMASVDGANFARLPLRTKLDGQMQDMPLMYYRALRWRFNDVGIDDVLVVKYRAKIKANPPSVSPKL